MLVFHWLIEILIAIDSLRSDATLSAADRPIRCMVLFWLFFVLVLVLVLDRACDCIIPLWSMRCSGGNLVMDWLMEIRRMIRELGNGGCGP